MCTLSLCLYSYFLSHSFIVVIFFMLLFSPVPFSCSVYSLLDCFEVLTTIPCFEFFFHYFIIFLNEVYFLYPEMKWTAYLLFPWWRMLDWMYLCVCYISCTYTNRPVLAYLAGIGPVCACVFILKCSQLYFLQDWIKIVMSRLYYYEYFIIHLFVFICITHSFL